MSTKIFFRFSGAIFGSVFFLLTIANSVHTQPLTFAPAPNDVSAANDVIQNFYKDPRPERLQNLLQSLKGNSTGWQAYPPAAGLLSVVFRRHPERIGPLTSGEPDAMAASTLAAALQLAGKTEQAGQFRSRLGINRFDPQLEAEFANLPARHEDIRIRIPTHLDILWGASFASGDGRYTKQIIGFFAETANVSEPIALDVAKLTVHMAGQHNDAIYGLKDKYGENRASVLLYAAVALWGVRSNAEQHAFTEAAREYIREHPDTIASSLLAMATNSGQPPRQR